MRKFITAGLAIAMLAAVPAAANANVAVDDQGVGFVGKGDVQTALGGINDEAMQQMWSNGQVKFTSQYKMATETRWQCSDGTTNSQTTTVVQSKPLPVAANTNKAGKLTNGWNLQGVNTSAAGTFVSGERTGAAYVGECPPNAYSTGFLPHVFSNTVVPGVYVNGISLPNTPVL